MERPSLRHPASCESATTRLSRSPRRSIWSSGDRPRPCTYAYARSADLARADAQAATVEASTEGCMTCPWHGIPQRPAGHRRPRRAEEGGRPASHCEKPPGGFRRAPEEKNRVHAGGEQPLSVAATVRDIRWGAEVSALLPQ